MNQIQKIIPCELSKFLFDSILPEHTGILFDCSMLIFVDKDGDEDELLGSITAATIKLDHNLTLIPVGDTGVLTKAFAAVLKLSKVTHAQIDYLESLLTSTIFERVLTASYN